MKELNFRKLMADEIQVRPTDTRKKGSCMLLLYQDARCAMNILDETVGQFGWQKRYENINGNIYCGIAIKDTDTNEWIWKYDCGAFTAKEEDMQSKADASDATKRAAVCWGIGRELYATPKLKINCPDSYYWNDKMNMTFTVSKIEWNENTLVDLVIVDRFGKTVYDLKKGGTNLFNEQDNTGMRVPQAPTEFDNFPALKEFCSKKKMEEGINKDELLRFFNFYEKKCAEWKKYKVDWEKKWGSWGSDAKKRNYPSSNDASIQQYEEATLGADDESFYY